MTVRGAIAALLLLGLASIDAAAAVVDGPYVVGTLAGNWQALTVDDAGGAAEKRVRTVAAGDSIQIRAVGERPAFSITLRVPETTAESDQLPWPSGVPVFVMADTHGEFAIATELLIRHKVLDRSLKWSFGKGRLVILGDVFDRGAHHTELLWLIYELEAQAKAAGGALHLLLGNHEMMVLKGDVRYLNARYFDTARILEVEGYAELWSRDTLLGLWLRSKPAVLKLGRVLFLHGGISRGTLAGRWTLRDINSTARSWLNDEKNRNDPGVAFISGADGPFWYRGYFSDGTEGGGTAQEIKDTHALYSVDRIVVGHTKVPTVSPLFGGSVVAVQVYPTRDRTTGRMNMEGLYIDRHGTWHKAKINGTREVLTETAQ